MTYEEIVPDLYQLSLGPVNAFLLRDNEGLLLIDRGRPDDPEAILLGIGRLGHGSSIHQNAAERFGTE